MFEIAIHQYNGRTARMPQCSPQRSLVAKVARERDVPHSLIASCQTLDSGERAVHRTIVSEDYLVRPDWPRQFGQAISHWDDILRFIVGRQHDREQNRRCIIPHFLMHALLNQRSPFGDGPRLKLAALVTIVTTGSGSPALHPKARNRCSSLTNYRAEEFPRLALGNR